MIRSAALLQTVSWPRRFVLTLAILVGGTALVTTAAAAILTQHEALHAQFCHEIDYSTEVELFVRAALGLVAPDPS
ncbi:MAG TPA: hypothetical protein VGO22_03330 [Pseudorhizobium sp.]|nr:hypothetical protein [Pseudorhizobium sp.]